MPTGTFTTLANFNGSNGADLNFVGLVQGLNGNLYGTTNGGGANGSGTVFEITPGGVLTTLYNFCSQTNCTDGSDPQGGLVLATNGNFYGTTNGGGANNYGTVFEITPAGKLTTLHSFDITDGDDPYAGLVQGTNGNLYGTTEGGGANNGGTVFEITPAGTLTTLYSFGSQANDGYGPEAGLVQATNGNLYGTTSGGGANSGGTIFQITPAGKLTALYSFCAQLNCADGNLIQAGLVQGTDGNFYGTTSLGGTSGYGTIYSLATGLGPFVETLPTSGKVGAAVKILGNSLTGATSVTFNGTSATFKVVSSTEITTTVPNGVTTGKVVVTTPSTTLTGNVNFRVTPTITSFSPTSGPAGTSVVITGVSLTGATSVTFGSVKATSFTVDSNTQITATVPAGAKTGKIVVTTPGGKATSTGTFTVTA